MLPSLVTHRTLQDDDTLLEEGKEFGLDGTIIQGLFEEAQKDEDMRQIQKWVVTTQNMRRKGRPYSYTAIAARDSYVRYTLSSSLSKQFYEIFAKCMKGRSWLQSEQGNIIKTTAKEKTETIRGGQSVIQIIRLIKFL